MTKRTNSRQKGARGERAAAAYLTTLGFVAARMGRNGYSAEDLDCRECPVLSRVHIEVKHDESFSIQGKALDDAVEQAMEGAGTIKPYAVLWKRNRHPWVLTFHAGVPPVRVNVTGDARVRASLIWLANASGER
jgi:hypothetical protein